MKEMLPDDDKDIGDTNKDKYYRYVGPASEIQPGKSKSFSISDERGKSIDVAVFNIDGQFYAISNTCIHKGAPLSKGFLEGDIVTCAWHGWKYCIRTGMSPHKGGDSVNSYRVRIVNKDKLYVNCIPSNFGKRVFHPHEAYVDLEKSVNDYLLHKSKDAILPIENNKRKTRILGISTTNANDRMAPRKSTSEEALRFALDYAHNYFEAETVMIKLRGLNFRHCEGYYSKNANACIFPCSISEIDKEDQMLEIYDRVILWADIAIIATPIRWGSASSLYYQMIQRMNCVQNQSITHGNYLIRDKVAGFIITGGQDNVQHVAGELMSFWSQLGFVFGKFPFVGWTRGWYAEDTENNYPSMIGEYDKDNSKPKSSVMMHEDIMRMIRGAVEMSRLVSNNRYDEKVLNFQNHNSGGQEH
ncbi:MAG TPA: Rieske 2Fe-2S domain-containing protein [Nitrososphaeraceae archaeon]|nr:Rieske 2Fe-2S domain-containing protein [Nitrososphaeraceae archaeon]